MKPHLLKNDNSGFLSDEYREQIKIYDENGFLILNNLFSEKDLSIINSWVGAVSNNNEFERVFEINSNTIRSIFGAHLKHQGFFKLCCLPRLIFPVMNLLGSEVYIHQFKINFKQAFEGDIWEWHQDYIFWKKEDNMPKPTVLTAMIFLDEVTEFNAPLFLIPRSHKLGVFDVEAQQNADLPSDAPEWLTNLTVKFKYGAEKEIVKHLINQNGIFSAKGKAGTVLLFDGNLFHASGVNLSPYDRKVVLITYNRVDNALRPISKPRPEFIASRKPSPINPVDDKLS